MKNNTESEEEYSARLEKEYSEGEAKRHSMTSEEYQKLPFKERTRLTSCCLIMNLRRQNRANWEGRE